MRKRLAAAVLLAVLVLLSSCAADQLPVESSEAVVASPAGQEEETSSFASLRAGDTESPQQSETEKPAEEAGELDAEIEESCAFITGMSMRMDGQTDITLDYVDWLSGDEARAAYLEDYPGATEEEMEGEGLFEIGYIRNINPKLRTYPAGDETQYYLPDPDNIAENVPVSYEEFLGRMFPAVDEGEDAYLTFVRVRVQDGTIQSIEWLYLP